MRVSRQRGQGNRPSIPPSCLGYLPTMGKRNGDEGLTDSHIHSIDKYSLSTYHVLV